MLIEECALRVNPLRHEAVDSREPIVTQTVHQVGEVLKEDRLGQFQSTAAPAEREGWQDSDAGRIA